MVLPEIIVYFCMVNLIAAGALLANDQQEING